ncbi:hypothetical protein [Pseudoalteromonas arctica]|nr:hypothetical protein [Pseudoalteromonas arctica]
MNKANMNTADTDIDFIKIVTGGKQPIAQTHWMKLKLLVQA